MAEDLPDAPAGAGAGGLSGPPPQASSLLRQALAWVPGCEQGRPPLALRLLHGGTTHTVYRVRTRWGSFVLRLHAAHAEALGVDHRREELLHAAAARVGVAPALIHMDAHGRFMVGEYVAGRAWEPPDMEDPWQLRRLCAQLAVLHGLAPPQVPAFDPESLLRRHAQRIISADPAAAGEVNAQVERACDALRQCAAAGRAACIIHGDLYHANILQSRRLYLIDWEYAAVADPLFDLACLLAYYPRAARHTGLLLWASGLADVAAPSMLQGAVEVYRALSELWRRVRAIPA